ncbi:MAG: FkbM family methyltransferase [Oscillospiraceae bacterium]|nr:FkbM family methyltransferase [Oscillospiraceae bacterium]
MLEFLKEKVSTWDRLKEEQRPIYLYGMGDGAVRILSAMRSYGIHAAGIFASDEFVRGHDFAGYPVKKLSEIEAECEDFVIVLAFAVCAPPMVDRMVELSKKHPLIVPDVPVVGGGLFTREYCEEHAEEIQAVYQLLADERSRRVYANILNFKISGKPEYLLDIVDSREAIWNRVICPTNNETYVDLGAYNGDSIRELLEYTRGKYHRIVAVEPDRKNYKKLSKFVGDTPSVKCYQCAAWCVDTELPFASKAGRQSSVSPDGTVIPARSVDNLMAGHPVTLLKMDVEGTEREALWGASRSIARFSPKLMISLYHRNEDIFELPLLVHKINPKYKLYIRHQLYIPAWETNLYAVADDTYGVGKTADET